MPQHHKSSTQIKLDRALSERTLLQTRLLKFRTTADLIHDETIQTRKDQRSAPWERYAIFDLKLQDLEQKLAVWEERIVDVEDRLVRLDEYCEELFVLEGSEKEKYDCAIGTSVLLTLLFAYDGVMMGLPHLNFWFFLVLPHVALAAAVVGLIWRRGTFHEFPTAYVIGFTAFLALAMMHQQNFLHNRRDWKGMQILLSSTNHRPGNISKILTIDATTNFTRTEVWTAFTVAMRDYWQTLVNYTNQIAP